MKRNSNEIDYLSKIDEQTSVAANLRGMRENSVASNKVDFVQYKPGDERWLVKFPVRILGPAEYKPVHTNLSIYVTDDKYHFDRDDYCVVQTPWGSVIIQPEQLKGLESDVISIATERVIKRILLQIELIIGL